MTEKVTTELLREIPDQITAYFDSRKLLPGEKTAEKLESIQEKFKGRQPDKYFQKVTEKLVEDAIKEGANRSEIDKLLAKEKNPDFRFEWMKLNAPKVTDEPGIQLNKIAAVYHKEEE